MNLLYIIWIYLISLADLIALAIDIMVKQENVLNLRRYQDVCNLLACGSN